MPNWCDNTVEIYHQDPAVIERVRNAFSEGKFLSEFIPCPPQLTDTVAGSVGAKDSYEQRLLEFREQLNMEFFSARNWYDWQVANWGSKWDVGGENAAQDIPGGLLLSFESAWSPPTQAYQTLVDDHGFRIRAMYYEPGMAFAGIWEDGVDDYYEYGGMNSDQIADTLPEVLDEAYGISEAVAMWEEEQNAEEND
jgi:hypothetical protein